MSKDKAYSEAIALSKKEKSEVVVYQANLGYGVSLLDKYDGNILDVVVTFSDGFVIE